jgi:hypothetical protein
VILDDPHNVIKAESDAEREKTVRFFRESMSNRLNDEQSAIVIIMQRLHENDVSGDVLNREADYCHLMIPMYFDPFRFPASEDGTATEDPETGEAYTGNDIGWIDPRASDDDGEVLSPRQLAAMENTLAWPDRFPRERVKEYEYELGQYAFAGQYQQSPTPRKGGIFKREYWQPYVPTRTTSGPTSISSSCRSFRRGAGMICRGNILPTPSSFFETPQRHNACGTALFQRFCSRHKPSQNTIVAARKNAGSPYGTAVVALWRQKVSWEGL